MEFRPGTILVGHQTKMERLVQRLNSFMLAALNKYFHLLSFTGSHWCGRWQLWSKTEEEGYVTFFGSCKCNFVYSLLIFNFWLCKYIEFIWKLWKLSFTPVFDKWFQVVFLFVFLFFKLFCGTKGDDTFWACKWSFSETKTKKTQILMTKNNGYTVKMTHYKVDLGVHANTNYETNTCPCISAFFELLFQVWSVKAGPVGLSGSAG